MRDDLERRAPELVPQIVFVSIDPQRDSAARIRAYLGNFDPEFIGVTAADEELAPLEEALGVTVHKMGADGENYNVTHNGTIYLVGPAARLRALFNESPQDAAAIASDYLLLRRRLKSPAPP